MYDSVRGFIRALDSAGELRRIAAPVSPILEVAQIADRVSKSRCAGLPSAAAVRTDPRFHDRGGHALLFENVRDSDFPLLINAWGSYRRMEMALGCEGTGFEAIGARIAELVKPQPPRSMGELLAKARQFLPLLRIGPRRLRGMGECQQIVRTGDDIDLRRLPIIRCWPHDGDFGALGYPPHANDGVAGVDRSPEFLREFGGRYITLGGIHTIHARDAGAPKPSSHNIGMYRVQLLGARTTAMHWHMHHDGASHWRSWKARGEPMPVAIALGGESVMPYAATCPLPPGISELLMAGFLHGKGIAMCRARTVPLWVPANAEIVIEGFVSHEAGGVGWDPRDAGAGPLGPGAVFEGPFGDHTGFYSLPDRYPILTVTAITHRRDAVYPTTIVGLPPQEDYYLGKATERIMLPLLRTIVHDIEDYHLPMFGAFHNCAFVRINKQYPLQARRVMHAIWGAGQMSWTKSVFVVDHDVDVHDLSAVMRAQRDRCDPLQDLELVRGPLDILDHAAPHLGAGTKIGFDCTTKAPAERTGPVRTGAPAPDADGSARNERALEVIRSVRGVSGASAPALSAGAWLFVRTDDATPSAGARVARDVLHQLEHDLGPAQAGEARVIVVVGGGVDVDDADAALFHWAANCDPGRDAVRTPRGGRLAFDATPKDPAWSSAERPIRQYPPLLVMDPATRDLVARRWGEYGLPAASDAT